VKRSTSVTESQQTIVAPSPSIYFFHQLPTVADPGLNFERGRGGQKYKKFQNWLKTKESYGEN